MHLSVFGLLVGLAVWASVDQVHLPGQRAVVSLRLSNWEASPAVVEPRSQELRQEWTAAGPAYSIELLPAITPRPVPVDRHLLAADHPRLDPSGKLPAELPAVAARRVEREEGVPRSQRAVDADRRRPAVVPVPPVQVGIETTPAQPLYNPLPVYPPEALSQGLDGRVVLRLTISPEGDVTELTVAISSGHAILDEAALAAVSRWRFIAATWAGRPVSWSARLPVHFRRS
ncbi:MAG: TonB family protein [Planctomycetales bacterium]|nr:TonB family protein [Planctomycetales bacterium]